MLGWVAQISDRLRQAGRARLSDPGHALGRRGEDLAHRFLEESGMRVVARNYRTPNGSGEVDLVAWDRHTLVFVEVKTRSSDDHGAPDRAIDEGKRDRLRRAAWQYARRARVDWARVRFDVLAVLIEPNVQIEHYRDAFPVSVRQ